MLDRCLILAGRFTSISAQGTSANHASGFAYRQPLQKGVERPLNREAMERIAHILYISGRQGPPTSGCAMHPHIVIIDQTNSTLTHLAPALEAAGFTVSHAGCDPNLVAAVRPDLLILSSQVPQSIGVEICRALRGQTATKRLPIIFLTPQQNPDDRVRSLEAGADDVVAEPVSVGELLARVQAQMRRSALQRETNILYGHGIKLDCQSHRVTRHGREVGLGPTEYRLLKFLMESKGHALTRAQIIAEIWPHDAEIDDRTVDVHLGRLRRAIDRRWEPNPIRTVRGVGYIFDSELCPSVEIRASAQRSGNLSA